jgi:diguanylate cyclase (GGDEF)-like protein
MEKVLLRSNILNFLFCLTILVYITYILHSKTDSSTVIALRRVVGFAKVGLVADMCSYIFDNRPGDFARVMNHVSMIVAVTMTALVGYFWNEFFDFLFQIRKEKYSVFVRRASRLLPTILIAVLLVINLFTGDIYYIDEHNVYHRGSWYFISFLCQYISFVICIVRATLIKVKGQEALMRTAKMRRTAILVGIIVIFFGLIQWATNGMIAVHCMGMTAGIIFMFVRFLDNQITRDRLTDLNNRYALDAHMLETVRAYNSKERSTKLFFVLMDVNDFKQINDVHGHLEGDDALRCLAAALRTVEHKNPKHLFVARYGGDEFAAVLEARDESAVASFSRELCHAIEKRTAGLSYDLSVSMGYSVYKGADMPLDEWIRKADEELYKNKARKK